MHLEIKLKTLTPLWTGGVEQTCDRLHETGLLGSLRWWYEALVRGLGGYACDPTSNSRCEYDSTKPEPPEKQLCAACYLFGCTGWARKFRLRVTDSKGCLVEDALNANQSITLHFIELRPLQLEEGWLLSKALWVASTYGALGGKTTLKPQRDARKGADYGIVQWNEVQPLIQKPAHLENYLLQFRQVDVGLPDLRWFFFVKGTFLWRKQINRLIGLPDNGRKIIEQDDYQNFLRGRRGSASQDAISKKLFSFRANGGRIWGYARDAAMRDKIIRDIRAELGQGNYTVKTGKEMLHDL